MKTKTVTFSFGTVKNAALEVPAEACSIMDIVGLIHKSYLAYTFRPGCGLMSDEVVVSSIGQGNFFAGALGGFETRLDAETFRLVKENAESRVALALAVVRFRKPGIDRSDAFLAASKNEALTADEREMLKTFAAAKL